MYIVRLQSFIVQRGYAVLAVGLDMRYVACQKSTLKPGGLGSDTRADFGK